MLATVTPLPVANHPTITIDPPPSGPEGRKVQVHGHVTGGGTYDRLSWSWRQETIFAEEQQTNQGLDGNTETITWQRPAVEPETRWDISATITAHGDGIVARKGTSSTSPRFRVHAPVEAYTPPAYILRRIDDDGTAVNITNADVTDDNGEVQRITGIRRTDSSGTATDIWTET